MRLPILPLLATLSATVVLLLPCNVQAKAPLPPLAAPVAIATLARPEAAGPLRVTVAFHLHHLHRIDDEAETFELSGILTLRWQDPGQAFDPAIEGVDEKVYSGDFQFSEVSPGWFPQVLITNALGAPDNQGVVYRVAPDGSSTVVQLLHVVARSGLELRRLPFDSQYLQLIFEVLGFDRDEVVLEPHSSGATMDAGSIRVPEWHLRTVSMTALPGSGAREDAGADAIGLLLHVERQPLFMARLVLLPLGLIVILSWSVFWMERSSLGDRMSVSFVGILTAVAYQSMVTGIMPNIAYMTFLNAFVVLSLLLMSATVLVNLLVAGFDKRGEFALGNHVDSTCRWLFPLLYLTLIGMAVLLTFHVLPPGGQGYTEPAPTWAGRAGP